MSISRCSDWVFLFWSTRGRKWKCKSKKDIGERNAGGLLPSLLAFTTSVAGPCLFDVVNFSAWLGACWRQTGGLMPPKCAFPLLIIWMTGIVSSLRHLDKKWNALYLFLIGHPVLISSLLSILKLTGGPWWPLLHCVLLNANLVKVITNSAWALSRQFVTAVNQIEIDKIHILPIRI